VNILGGIMACCGCLHVAECLAWRGIQIERYHFVGKWTSNSLRLWWLLKWKGCGIICSLRSAWEACSLRRRTHFRPDKGRLKHWYDGKWHQSHTSCFRAYNSAYWSFFPTFNYGWRRTLYCHLNTVEKLMIGKRRRSHAIQRRKQDTSPQIRWSLLLVT